MITDSRKTYTNEIVLYEFRHCIFLMLSPEYVLSGPKYIVVEIIKTSVCGTVSPKFYFELR
jgi:hypothetical protein